MYEPPDDQVGQLSEYVASDVSCCTRPALSPSQIRRVAAGSGSLLVSSGARPSPRLNAMTSPCGDQAGLSSAVPSSLRNAVPAPVRSEITRCLRTQISRPPPSTNAICEPFGDQAMIPSRSKRVRPSSRGSPPSTGITNSGAPSAEVEEESIGSCQKLKERPSRDQPWRYGMGPAVD